MIIYLYSAYLKKYLKQLYENIMEMLKYNSVFYIEMW